MKLRINESADSQDRDVLVDKIYNLYDKYRYRRDPKWEDGTDQIPTDIVGDNYAFGDDAIEAASVEELQRILSEYKSLEQKLYGPLSKRAELANQIKAIYSTKYSNEDLDSEDFWRIISNNGEDLFYKYHKIEYEDEGLNAFLEVASLNELSQILKELNNLPEPKHLPVTEEAIIAKYYKNNNSPSKEESYVISDLAGSTGGRTMSYDIDYGDQVYMQIDLYTDTTDKGLYDAEIKVDNTYQKYIKEYQNKLNLNYLDGFGAFGRHWDDGYSYLQGNVTLLVALIRAYESGDYTKLVN